MKGEKGGHTPLPWRLGRPHKVGMEYGEFDEEVILGPNGESVLFPGDIGGFPKDEDAEFVIRAVNAHEELLAAVKIARTRGTYANQMTDEQINDILDKAISKAKPPKAG